MLNGRINSLAYEKINYKEENPEKYKLKPENRGDFRSIKTHGSQTNSRLWELSSKIKRMSNLVYKKWHDHMNLLLNYLLIGM